MAVFIPFPFPKAGVPAKIEPPVGISTKDFINRCRLHLAGYAIYHGVPLAEVDRFALDLEIILGDPESKFTPVMFLTMIRDETFYTMLDTKFAVFLTLDK